ALMAVPAIIAIVIPAVALFLIYRRDLLRSYEPSRATVADDRVLLVASGVTLAVLIPLLVSGLPVWIPAVTAALVLGGFFLVRRRAVLRFGLLPWRLILLAAGLFLVVQAGHSLGLGAVLSTVSGHGNDPLGLLRLSASGALGANTINNLPAYLALEPVAGSPIRIAALLIGINAGPLITPWASLATLLWHERLKSLDVQISWPRYCLLGLVVAPLTVAAATFALALLHPAS
ncbi:MAG: SLC13 family permease, partial [Lacisediminihabitans sp.]